MESKISKKTIHSKSCASNYTEVFQINVDYKITNNLARRVNLWTIIFVKCKQIHSTILILNFQKYNWPKYSFVSWQPYIGCRHLNLQSICSCTNKFAYFLSVSGIRFFGFKEITTYICIYIEILNKLSFKQNCYMSTQPTNS